MSIALPALRLALHQREAGLRHAWHGSRCGRRYDGRVEKLPWSIRFLGTGIALFTLLAILSPFLQSCGGGGGQGFGGGPRGYIYGWQREEVGPERAIFVGLIVWRGPGGPKALDLCEDLTFQYMSRDTLGGPIRRIGGSWDVKDGVLELRLGTSDSVYLRMTHGDVWQMEPHPALQALLPR